ncbi:DUF7405 family protein [Haloferax mucosum]|nr:twin-arginine translocation signal domain-containing protein [Haloferax mucosum]
MFDGSPSRRAFLKAAVAAGGAAALSACLDRAPADPVPSGTAEFDTLPDRQHAWNDVCATDEHGNVEVPYHHVLLYLDVSGSGPPTKTERATVERAFHVLDRAYERTHEGLIWSVGYSPRYFKRFDESLPAEIDLPEPRALSPFETPEFDRQDALVHLAADRADVVLEAEQALLGERDEANGVAVETDLSGVFSVADRRTGFVGAGLPAKHQSDLNGIPDGNPVPEQSPLFMGFKAGFAKNQATEDYVTIADGPFAGGTTKHVANLRQRLRDWYDEEDQYHRIMKLFSPGHAEQGLVEGIGENLGDDSGIDTMLDRIRDDAEAFGHVGHAQKAARANRDADGNVKLLRRHFESADDDVAALHFPSLQRGISDFEAVREAMNGTDLTEIPTIRQRVNNGILEYIFVKHRGNFLVPPRRLRALPTPTGDAPMPNE